MKQQKNSSLGQRKIQVLGSAWKNHRKENMLYVAGQALAKTNTGKSCIDMMY